MNAAHIGEFAALGVRHGVPFDPHLSAQQILLLGPSGILGLTLGDSLLYLGYQILGTRRAMLVQSLHPLMGAIAAWLILSERMNAQAWAGMVVAMAAAGIALLLLR